MEGWSIDRNNPKIVVESLFSFQFWEKICAEGNHFSVFND